MTKALIIAEAGVNHNGSLDMALQLVDAAAEAGVDAVKFQTFKAEQLVSKIAGKADYQKKTTDEKESQLAMLKKLELDDKAHNTLIKHCNKRGIQFLSTPFDFDSLALLSDTFNLPLIKLSSGEITNAPMLLKAAQTGKTIILSTGMSTLGDIEMALGVLSFGYLRKEETPSIIGFRKAYFSEEGQQLLKDRVSLLHCTTEYPTPFTDVNLRVMDTLRDAFGLPVGLSDHTPGITIPIAAVARGANIIEKHFTLDKSLPGPDHAASLDAGELKDLVRAIRQVEEALGNSVKVPVPSELKNISAARKSLVASADIEKGQIFTKDNLTVKRPGTGISPIYYWEWLGKPADKEYKADEVIEL